MEEKFCLFCGSPLDEKGACPVDHAFKKMCLNCEFFSHNTCINSKNLENAKAKILEKAKEVSGYGVVDITIEPLPIKKPTLKCGNWSLDEKVKNNIVELFK